MTSSTLRCRGVRPPASAGGSGNGLTAPARPSAGAAPSTWPPSVAPAPPPSSRAMFSLLLVRAVPATAVLRRSGRATGERPSAPPIHCGNGSPPHRQFQTHVRTTRGLLSILSVAGGTHRRSASRTRVLVGVRERSVTSGGDMRERVRHGEIGRRDIDAGAERRRGGRPTAWRLRPWSRAAGPRPVRPGVVRVAVRPAEAPRPAGPSGRPVAEAWWDARTGLRLLVRRSGAAPARCAVRYPAPAGALRGRP